MDVLVPCAACFNRFKTAQHHLDKDKALRSEIEHRRREVPGGRVRNPLVVSNDVGLDTLAGRWSAS